MCITTEERATIRDVFRKLEHHEAALKSALESCIYLSLLPFKKRLCEISQEKRTEAGLTREDEETSSDIDALAILTPEEYVNLLDEMRQIPIIIGDRKIFIP